MHLDDFFIYVLLFYKISIASLLNYWLLATLDY